MSEVYGEHCPPAAYYEVFKPYSRGQLEEWAAGITPRKVGRPKRGSRYAALAAEVDEVRARRKGISMRAACQVVAGKTGVSANMLRKVCRAKR